MKSPESKSEDFCLIINHILFGFRMNMNNKFAICFILIVILTACIVCTGCTSTQTKTSAQSNAPPITTPLQTSSPTSAPETLITPLAPTPAQNSTCGDGICAVPSTISPGNNDLLTLTLNSAEKKTTLGNGVGKPGRSMLILDVTIKNNDKRNDFKYTDSSFVISYKSNEDRLTAITTQYAKGLINPLISGTVPAGSTDDGKILFGVNATSNSYKLFVVDSNGKEIASVDNINVT
jgi:hypothetical protein